MNRKKLLISCVLLIGCLTIVSIYSINHIKKQNEVEQVLSTNSTAVLSQKRNIFEIMSQVTEQEFNDNIAKDTLSPNTLVEITSLYFTNNNNDSVHIQPQKYDTNSIYFLESTGKYTLHLKLTHQFGDVDRFVEFTVADTIAPTITGHKDIQITVGESFDPLNAIETLDNSGESITPLVTMDVNTEVPGTYTVNLTATDSSNNSTTVSYSVSVKRKVVVNPTPAPKPTNTQALYIDTNRVLVNKKHLLSSSYIPKNLVSVSSTYAVQGRSISLNKEAYNAFVDLSEAMNDTTTLGRLTMNSGYRSYAYQSTIYTNYVKSYGEKEANRFSAKPGASEHQTGLAIDVCTGNKCLDDFVGTSQAEWLSKNAHTYGFIIRYKDATESITGYMGEPWHIRYLGIDLATDIYKSNLTYEEYLGVD